MILSPISWSIELPGDGRTSRHRPVDVVVAAPIM
jgi:hypothetical protein